MLYLRAEVPRQRMVGLAGARRASAAARGGERAGRAEDALRRQ